MSINFNTDGGKARRTRRVSQPDWFHKSIAELMPKAVAKDQRQRLIEEKELVQDRIACIERALYYLGQAELHLEIDEIGRKELVKLGKEKV